MADQPNYTRIPNDLLDAMDGLGNAELRVLLAVARKTVGYQKECDRISVSQIAKMTGLTNRNTQQAITALLQKGHITRVPAGKQAYCYTLQTISPRDTVENHIPSDTISPRDMEPYPLGTRLEQKPYPLGITQKKDSKEKKEKSARARDPALDTLPIIAYRETFKCWPNSTQRKAINDTVTDLDHWQTVLNDWHMHGWRPTNVKGMIDRYSQNGYFNGKHLRQSANGHSERKPQRETDLDAGF